MSEEGFKIAFKETLSDKEKHYDAYLREIYYLGKHRLTHKYFWIRIGLWGLLAGLVVAALLTRSRFPDFESELKKTNNNDKLLKNRDYFLLLQ